MLKSALLLSTFALLSACAGAKQMPLRFATSGEYDKPWFSSDRELELHGTVYNEGPDTFVNMDCTASLELSFSGREEPVVLQSEGCPWFSRINPRSGVHLASGKITIDSKWFGYNISRARLRLKITAENPFKEKFYYNSEWEEIPQPIYDKPFKLGW